MRIAYTTTFDANDIHNWSGTPYYMSRSLVKANIDVDYIGPLKCKLPKFFKAKQIFSKLIADQRESPRFNVTAAKYYSEQTAKCLENLRVDAIVSPLVNPIAFLNTNKPIILWTDALYAALLGFYPPFSHHSANSIRQGNLITRECLARCNYVVFSSDWAANSAIELYGANRDKVKVIPFGANIDFHPDQNTIRSIIKNRSSKSIKLLFLAKSWERKGGDVVLAVAKKLHESGHPVELTIAGYYPPNLKSIPAYVKCLGYVSKDTAEGRKLIQQTLADTHFLFVPSKAEAYGIVFCEANAFGVPCLTTHVGGIATIVKNHVNGMTFGVDTSVEQYCHYIIDLTQKPKEYEELALSSYNEYQTRLNWNVAAMSMRKLLESLK